MIMRRHVLLSFGVWVFLWAQAAPAQQPRGTVGNRAERARPHGFVPGLNLRGRERKGTAYSNRFRGIQTHFDRLRSVASWMSQSGGLLPGPTQPQTPIQRLFDQRNLLRARSPLGQTGTAFLGRYALGSSGQTAPAAAPTSQPAGVTTGPADDRPTPVRFEDVLANRLDRMAEENFELGMTYFREGDFLKARHHFDMAGNVWRDKPRCHIATMLVAYEMQDMNQAVNELMRALQMAKTLDDLKIEGFLDKFYVGDDTDKKRQALSRTVDSINMFAQSVKDAPAASAANVLLAYYSWLNGDLVAAASAADRALRTLPEATAEPVRRFRDMLVESQRAPETGTTAQPPGK
jgi:hypothetical protein